MKNINTNEEGKNKIVLIFYFRLDQGHAHLARLIERDLWIVSADSAPLPENNQKQQEAIDKALTQRFSLIQGPPGI